MDKDKDKDMETMNKEQGTMDKEQGTMDKETMDTMGSDTMGSDTVGSDTVGSDTVGSDTAVTVSSDTVSSDTAGMDLRKVSTTALRDNELWPRRFESISTIDIQHSMEEGGYNKIYPIWVYEDGDDYVILRGHRRHKAAVACKLACVWVKVIPRPSSLADELVIIDDHGQRTLSPGSLVTLAADIVVVNELKLNADGERVLAKMLYPSLLATHGRRGDEGLTDIEKIRQRFRGTLQEIGSLAFLPEWLRDLHRRRLDKVIKPSEIPEEFRGKTNICRLAREYVDMRERSQRDEQMRKQGMAVIETPNPDECILEKYNKARVGEVVKEKEVEIIYRLKESIVKGVIAEKPQYKEGILYLLECCK